MKLLQIDYFPGERSCTIACYRQHLIENTVIARAPVFRVILVFEVRCFLTFVGGSEDESERQRGTAAIT